MDKRQAIGSWLSGPRAAAEDMGVDMGGHRGQALGLPESGPGAIAPLGRRFGALFIDWGLCVLVGWPLSGGDMRATSNWALAVFVVLSILTVGTVGATPGKLLLRLRVIGEGGVRLTLPRAVLRSVLLALVIPAVVWDRDTRGLHDRLSRSVQIRT
ncbi:RDD family protein [Streptomyces sp. NA02950]|uniref:RDD family protein n=1 Tax=Streptomyces sp. NA02950 TaxID=2742137 RepID=UPI0015924E05|nr:RDD family protein [Streptomyces sp. NA02950]QKV95375.1 RDD family protein [Streptomyces sp. NA02950]